MVLDAHDVLGRDFKTFKGVVMEVAVSNDDLIFRKRFFVDNIAVVLRRDIDP